MVELDALIRASRELEPLPASAARLAHLIAAPDPDLDAIVDVIGYDQGLTARLLRYANSASSAARQPITTVRGAVIRLGLGVVLASTMAAFVRGNLRRPLPQYRLDEEALWRHSLAAALAAECVAGTSETALPPESFTAALLHDVGKLVLARFLEPELLGWLHRAVEEGGHSPLSAEAELLGVHHAELGGLIARQWKLPDSIVLAVAYHHEPEQGAAPVVDAVHVANAVAKAIPARQAESASDASAVAACPALEGGPLRRLGLSEPALAAVVDTAAARFDEVLALYA